VRRYPDVHYARAVRLEATATGRRILERGRARRLDLLERLLDGATEEEIAAIETAATVVERAVGSA
jgi:DNA-binding MarR family transcriptional regulator